MPRPERSMRSSYSVSTDLPGLSETPLSTVSCSVTAAFSSSRRPNRLSAMAPPQGS